MSFSKQFNIFNAVLHSDWKTFTELNHFSDYDGIKRRSEYYNNILHNPRITVNTNLLMELRYDFIDVIEITRPMKVLDLIFHIQKKNFEINDYDLKKITNKEAVSQEYHLEERYDNNWLKRIFKKIFKKQITKSLWIVPNGSTLLFCKKRTKKIKYIKDWEIINPSRDE